MFGEFSAEFSDDLVCHLRNDRIRRLETNVVDGRLCFAQLLVSDGENVLKILPSLVGRVATKPAAYVGAEDGELTYNDVSEVYHLLIGVWFVG